jgi:diguanylate cyclase (GGDEF)-like protein
VDAGPPPVAGYLRFALDVSDTVQQLRALRRLLGQAAVTLVLIVIPFTLMMTRHVVLPVNELAQTARAIAEGSMDARAQVRSQDEIGALAQSLNVMADRVAGSQMELLELNAELEKRVQQRTRDLEELASRDPLTELYNRRYFGDVIGREFAVAERYDADMTCLMFDLDRFKEANDLFGHRTGDAILISLARAIAGELRESDVAARFGGDEFIVLLPQTSADAAAMLVERITQRFAEETAKALPEVPTGVSVGVASLRTTRAKSAEALIHEADVALYAAKEGGRSRTMSAPRAVATR